MFLDCQREDAVFVFYTEMSTFQPFHCFTVRQLCTEMVNLLNPTGHVMHQQVNIQQLYVLPTLLLCVLYLSEKNSDLCHLQHKLVGFYNRDEKCLLRGTKWLFK